MSNHGTESPLWKEPKRIYEKMGSETRNADCEHLEGLHLGRCPECGKQITNPE